MSLRVSPLASQVPSQSAPQSAPQFSELAELQTLRLQVAQALDRERAWQAVSDTARDLTVLREPQRVLQAIVERGRALLGSHVAWIAFPDSHREGELVVQAIDGVSTEWAQQMRAASGRGVVGYVRRTRSPFATSDYFAETRVVHDAHLDDTLRGEGVQSMVAVPMLSGVDLLGVLVVADRSVRSYTHLDIAALGTLAAHAVVAVLNAQAFAQTRTALAQAEHSNAQMQQKTAALELAADAHERLTRLVARGATLLDVCRTVASLLAVNVVLLDAADAVVCSAQPEGLGQIETTDADVAALMKNFSVHAALDESRLSGRSVAASATAATLSGSHGRIAAIVGGRRLLGGLFTLSAVPLSDVEVRTLERSALVLAVMLLSPGRLSEHAASWRESLLLDMLNPLRTGNASLARQAAAHGFQDDGTPVLALMQTSGGNTSITPEALVRALRERLPARRSLVDELNGTVVVLSWAQQPEPLRRLLEQTLADAPGVAARGLVSAPCATFAALPAALASLQRGLALLDALGGNSGIRLEAQLAPYVAAFSGATQTDTGVLTGFIEATIGPLLAHDSSRAARLAPSLLMYLELGCNARAAAVKLGIHVNTLNNRLAGAAALLGPWDAPGRGFELHLALRLAALQ